MQLIIQPGGSRPLPVRRNDRFGHARPAVDRTCLARGAHAGWPVAG